MKKLMLIIFASLFLGGCTITSPLSKNPAGLDITSTPTATVYLNDEQVGETPYSNSELKAGDYQVKLVPNSPDNLPPWETQLTIKPEVTTIINKTFAASETDSASYILELRPEPGEATYLSVISDPDTVNLNIDGKSSGYTPITKLASTPGAHQLSLSSPGYKPLDLSVNASKGYNLIINVKLSADLILLTTPEPASTSASPALTKSESPEPADLADTPTNGQADTLTPYVLIQETGTGWLRVRKEPSSSGEELGKVNVGEKLPYLGETSETGWHQVEFEGSKGWLSAKYATLVK